MSGSVPMPDPATTYGGPGNTASGHPHRVESRQQAADLAAWLRSPHRRLPILVVSSRIGPPDLATVAREHAGQLECYLVGNRRITRVLSNLLPEGASVYGEAVRYYPARQQWSAEQAPLVPYHSLDEVPTIMRRLVADGHRTDPPQRRADEHAKPPPSPERGHPTEGVLELAADGAVHEIRTDGEAAALAGQLIDPHRRWPVAVVSVHPDAAGPYLDPAALAERLEDVAAVVLISADASYGLTDALGDKRLSVFYGAGRVYPPGTAWIDDMYRAPLHLCLSPNRGRRVTAAMATDALSAALAAGLMTRPAPRPEDEPVTVTVRSTLGPGHAMVRTGDGRDAVMMTARLGSELPAEQLVRKGQQLRGLLRHTDGLMPSFLPDEAPDQPGERALAALPDGSRTLAKVRDATGHEATLELHPEVPVVVDTGEDDAAYLLSPGDVVAVEVVWEDGTAYGALLGDVTDPATLVPAIGILPGGPPWLTPADAAAATPPAGHGEAAVPEMPDVPVVSVAVAELDVDEARRQLSNARDAGELLTLQLAEAEAQRDRLAADVRDLKQQLRKAASKRNRGAFATVWSDPEQQLRHEIELAYLLRIDETDRPTRPLPARYGIGPGFVDSLADLQGISRDKVLSVLVECLVGLDRELTGRQRHPWLERRAGNQATRTDGAAAWRVSLQSNTPGARRLKYWVLRDGTIEFDSVGHHDAGLA